MRQLNDLSRTIVTFEQGATLIAVIEMSLSSWLVAGIVPRIDSGQVVVRLHSGAGGTACRRRILPTV